jgi:non-specific serine/threonine protein kinase
MAVPEIAERLGDRFALLVGGVRTAPARHQTLRAALDWSYESLSTTERRFFACLSVFSSSFTIEAAEAVCPDGPPAALETLTRLVDKSLVVADRSEHQGRYRLPETTRQYGYEKLVDAGMEASARRAQLRWTAVLAEAAEAGLEGPEQPAWLHRLDREYDNIGGALEWAAAHPDAFGQRTAAALWRYWEIRGFLSEGRSRLEALLDADAPAPLRAKAMNSAGVLAQGQGDHAAARTFYMRALEIHRAVGDRVGMAAALNGLGNVAVGQDDLFRARSIFEQNLATSQDLGDQRVVAASLMNLGVVAQLLFVSGRIDRSDGAAQAQAYYLDSLDLYRRLGDTRGTSQALENLGVIAPYLGDDARAADCLEASLVLRRELRDRSGIAAAARFLGHLAFKKGEYDAARSLHEECFAIECDLGNELLMTADLASLAEIAIGEGNQNEARRLRTLALGMSHRVGDDAVRASRRVMGSSL